MDPIIHACVTEINDIGRGFCAFAGGMFVQSTVLIVILLAADWLLRKRVKATFRYWIWMLVFIKLILPPTLSLPTGIGYWYHNWIAAYRPVSQMATVVPVQEPIRWAFADPELDAAAESIETPDNPPIRPVGWAPGYGSLPDTTSGPAVLRTGGVVANSRDKSAHAEPRVRRPRIGLTWQGAVFLLWLAGAAGLCTLLIHRVLFVRSLVAQSRPADDSLMDLLGGCCRQMGVRRPVGLRLSSATFSPAVCGLLRPVILLPGTLLRKLSRRGLRAVLVHELAHIKRGDLWLSSVQTLLQIVYYYNPFVWLANVMVRRVREQAVDEMVLVALGAEAKSYSRTLVDIAEMAFFKPNWTLRLIGVAESKKSLEGRIKHMLTRPIPKNAKLGLSGAILVLIAATLLLPMAKGAGRRNQTTVDDANSPSVNGLRASISCSTPEIKLGEPVVVTLWLENTRDKDVVYYDFRKRWPDDEAEVITLLVDRKPVGGHTTLDVNDAGYKVVGRRELMNKATERPGGFIPPQPVPREAFGILRPGEKVAYLKVDLRPVWFLYENSKKGPGPFQTAGAHSVQIEYLNTADGRQFGLSAWTGSVKSNVISVRLTRPASEDSAAAAELQPLEGRSLTVRVYLNPYLDTAKYVTASVPVSNGAIQLTAIKEVCPAVSRLSYIFCTASDQTEEIVAKAFDGHVFLTRYMDVAWRPRWSGGGARRSYWQFFDAEGTPMAGASVEMKMMPAGIFTFDAPGVPLGRAVLDGQGRTERLVLAGGAVIFTVRHPNYGIASVPYRSDYESPRGVYTVALAKKDSPAAAQSIQGTIVDSDNHPAVGVHVRCSPADSFAIGNLAPANPPSNSEAVTDEMGHFTFCQPTVLPGSTRRPSVPAGSRYTVQIEPPRSSDLRQLDSRSPIVAQAGDRPTYTLTRMDARTTFHTFAFKYPDRELTSAGELNEITLTLVRDNREWLKLAYNDFKDGCVLPSGTLNVEMGSWERGVIFPTIEVAADSPRQLVFQAPSPMVFRGKVVDGTTGKPMPGVYVEVLPSSRYEAVDPGSWTPQQWQQLKDRAARYAAEDARERIWRDPSGQVLVTGQDGGFEARLVPIRFNSIVEFTGYSPGYAAASVRMSSVIQQDLRSRPVFPMPQPNADGVMEVPTIQMLRPEQVYFPRFVFEDENGPVTDSDKLKAVNLTFAKDGRGGSRPLDEFLKLREFFPGVFSARATWGGKLYLFDEVDLTTARPDVVTFKPREVRRSDITYRGQVVHALTGEPIPGAVVLYSLYPLRLEASRLEPRQWDALKALGANANPQDPALKPLYDSYDMPRPQVSACMITDREGRFQFMAMQTNELRRNDAIHAYARDFLSVQQQLYAMVPSDTSSPGSPGIDSRFEPDANGIATLPPIKMPPAATIRMHLVVPDAGSNLDVGRLMVYWRISPGDEPGWFQEMVPNVWRNASGMTISNGFGLEANVDQTMYVPAGVRLTVSIDQQSSRRSVLPRSLEPMKLAQGEVKALGRIELPSAIGIVVKVVDANGSPVVGMSVTCRPDDSTSTGGATDAAGAIKLGVAPRSSGRIMVTATDPATGERLEESIPYKVAGPEDAGKEFTLKLLDNFLRVYRLPGSRPTRGGAAMRGRGARPPIAALAGTRSPQENLAMLRDRAAWAEGAYKSVSLSTLAKSVASDLDQANALYQATQYAEAEQIYLRLLKTEANDGLAALYTAGKLPLVYLAMDNQRQTQLTVERLLANFAERDRFPAVLREMVKGANDIKRVGELGRVFDTALTARPGRLQVLWLRMGAALVSLCQKDDRAVDAALWSLIAEHGADQHITEVFAQVAAAARDLRQFDRALSVDQYVVDNWPSKPRAVFSQGGLAYTYLITGEDSKADSAVEKLKTRFAGDKDLGEIVFTAAEMHRQEKKYRQACDLYAYVLNQCPASEFALPAEGYLILSSALAGDDQATQAAIKDLSARFPKDQRLLDQILRTAQELNWAAKTDQACRLYQGVAADWPNAEQAASARMLIAEMEIASLIDAGDQARAAEAIEALATKLKGSDYLPTMLYHVGEKYEVLNQYENAQTYYRRTVAVGTDAEKAASAQLSIGWIYYEQGMYDDALREDVKVAANYPKSSLAPHGEWWVKQDYHAKGDLEAVRKQCAKIVQTYPGTKEAGWAKQFLGQYERTQEAAAMRAAQRGMRGNPPAPAQRPLQRPNATQPDVRTAPATQAGADANQTATDYGAKVSEILQRYYATVDKAYADEGVTKEDRESLLMSQQVPERLNSKMEAYQRAWPAIVKARSAAQEEMASLGPGAVPVLLKAREMSGENRTAVGFAQALTRIGTAAVPAIIDGLSDRDPVTRARAADALRQIRDQRAVDPLIQALTDSDANVLRGVLLALTSLPDPKAVEPLLALWQKHNLNVDYYVAGALAATGDKRAVEPIMAALEQWFSNAKSTQNWRSRSWEIGFYIRALGDLQDARAVPLLKEVLGAGPQATKEGPKYMVADEAAAALRHFGYQVTGSVEKGGYTASESPVAPAQSRGGRGVGARSGTQRQQASPAGNASNVRSQGRQRLNDYAYSEQPADGQTHVFGTIHSDTTWTAQKSPYVLDENVFVSQNTTLTIEPGVTVKVKRLTENTALIDAYVTLAVFGTLRAEGRPDAMIRFAPVSDKPDAYREWQGIVVERGSSTSILKWVLVRDAIFGIDAYGSALVTHCVFLKCHSGIYLENDFVGDVRHNVSAYNAFSGIRCKGTRAEATITDNICYENADGIDAWLDAVAYADYNLYWSSRRNPAQYYIGMAAGPHDLTTDPRFIDPQDNDFRLLGDSPVKSAGLCDYAWNEKVGLEEDRVWLSNGARRLWCEGLELERRSRPAAVKKTDGMTAQESAYRNPAAEKFRQALELASTPELKDMITCSLSRVLISEANYAPAEEMLQAVVSRSTQARIRDLARRGLADVWALDGRTDEALRIVQATEWAQSQVWVKPAVARYSAMSGDYETASRSLADVKAASPDRYLKAVSDMVSGALSASQIDAAVKIMDGFDAYPLAPQRFTAYLNIAKLARSQGRPEVAVDLLYKSTKADPFCREATESLSLLAATLKDDLNRPDEAQAVLVRLCRDYSPYDFYVQQAAQTVRPESVDPKRMILLDSSLGEWSIYDRGPTGSNNFGQYEVIRALADAGHVVHVNDPMGGPTAGRRTLELDWIQRYGLIILNGRYGGVADPPIPPSVIDALVDYVKAGGNLLVISDGGGIGNGKTAQYYNPLLRPFGLSFLEDVSLPSQKGRVADHPAVRQVPGFNHVHGAPVQVRDGEVLGYVDMYPVIASTRFGDGKVVAAGLGPILTGGNLRMEQESHGDDNNQGSRRLLLALTAYLLSP